MNNIEIKVKSAVENLKINEQKIIANDISERTITHKLAEYLQKEFLKYNVDCEYNRNFEAGERKPKAVYYLTNEIKEKLKATEWTVENIKKFTEQVSSYPDIIIHKRLTNDLNILVIEVKKNNNNSDWEIDKRKLEWYTTSRFYGGYGYKYGLHLTIYIQKTWKYPNLKWYQDGECVASLNDI